MRACQAFTRAMVVGAAWGTVAAGVAVSPTYALPERSESMEFPPTRAQPRLVAESVGVQPGGRVVLAVTFAIDKGWHLYWTGRNDSGFAPRINLRLPEGFTAEPMQWPAPKRYLQPGDILDHIYEERLTVLIPVRAPRGLKPGAVVEISAELSWLVCEEVCIPESGSVRLTLPILSEAGGPGADAGLFGEARARLPRPIDKDSGIKATVSKTEVEFRAAGASVMRFFPTNECVPTPRLIEDGEARGERLRVRLGPSETDGLSKVIGVLEVRRSPESEPRYFSVELDVPT